MKEITSVVYIQDALIKKYFLGLSPESLGNEVYSYQATHFFLGEETQLRELFPALTQVFFLGNAKIDKNIDLKSGDICIPNVLTNGKDTKFVKEFTGENYDLQKFGVMLSGICATTETDDFSDIIDTAIPSLAFASIEFHYIGVIEPDEQNVGNIFPILDFILS